MGNDKPGEGFVPESEAVVYINDNPAVTHFIALFGHYQHLMEQYLKARPVVDGMSGKRVTGKKPLQEVMAKDLPASEAVFLTPNAFSAFMIIYGHELENMETPLNEDWLTDQLNYSCKHPACTVKDLLELACKKNLLAKSASSTDGRKKVFRSTPRLKSILEDATDKALAYTGPQPYEGEQKCQGS